MIPAIDTIVWDWNGTLLDDTDLCIRSINPLLKARGLKEIQTEQYLERFDFPVINYYQSIGFDFKHEPFEVPALQFIDNYSKELDNCQLHSGALEVLEFFNRHGFRQIILSAMEKEKLDHSVQRYSIRHFFEAISGLDHDYATSKVEIGRLLFDQLKVDPMKTCLIGDTLHDLEVARELGCLPLLVANGHQSPSRLLAKHQLVLNSISEVVVWFQSNRLLNGLTEY